MILNINYYNIGLVPTKNSKLISSYVPLMFLLFICLIYPDVTKVYMSFGMTLWSINGYIYPYLFKIHWNNKENKNIFYNIILIIIILSLIVLSTLGLLSNFNLI